MTADQARVSVSVGVAPAEAFRVFTEQIDQWWRRGVKFRHAGSRRGFMHVEPCAGGRMFEAIEGEGTETVIEVGRIRVWDPPQRLVFSWRNANFAAGESTEVEVEFRSAGAGTLVCVTHRGWGALRDDHPARHGLVGADFSRMIGLWWGDQLTSLRRHSEHLT